MASIEQVLKKAGRLRRQSRALLLFAAVTAGMGFQQAQAQTFAEWFKQKSTQKKYLLQQISALLVYRQYARQGYAIAQGGLGSIGNYLGSEFGLHREHYERLRQVNPEVRKDPQVQAILHWQQDILLRTNELKKVKGLKAKERDHIRAVCASLLSDCDGQLHDLEVLLTDGKAELSDEQRLRQLARVHRQMQDNYRFASSFQHEVMSFLLQREQEQKGIDQLKEVYGNND